MRRVVVKAVGVKLSRVASASRARASFRVFPFKNKNKTSTLMSVEWGYSTGTGISHGATMNT